MNCDLKNIKWGKKMVSKLRDIVVGGGGVAYGLGPGFVFEGVCDRDHDIPTCREGYGPRGGIVVDFAQVCTKWVTTM